MLRQSMTKYVDQLGQDWNKPPPPLSEPTATLGWGKGVTSCFCN